MSELQVGPGAVLGFGGTNARFAYCAEGDINGFRVEETPTTPNEFFAWMARRALEAADSGHNWLVAGYPGPVSRDGNMIGPLANVAGLSNGQYDVERELVTADNATRGLLKNGFRIYNVNDGNLAGHAAEIYIGRHRYNRVAALIFGTGVGAGVVYRSSEYRNVYHTDLDPLEIGHTMWGDCSDTRLTYENMFSGPALAERFGADPRTLEADHEAWPEVAVAVRSLATLLGLMKSAELVVPCGGVGGGAAEKYLPHLESRMAAYTNRANGTQRLLMPDIRTIPPNECQVFELFGAEGVARDNVARQIAEKIAA